MTTRGQEYWSCPYCRAVDQEIFNRRKLRQEIGTRSNRREQTKSGVPVEQLPGLGMGGNTIPATEAGPRQKERYAQSRDIKVRQTRARVRLAEKIKQKRRKHERSCSERK